MVSVAVINSQIFTFSVTCHKLEAFGLEVTVFLITVTSHFLLYLIIIGSYEV